MKIKKMRKELQSMVKDLDKKTEVLVTAQLGAPNQAEQGAYKKLREHMNVSKDKLQTIISALRSIESTGVKIFPTDAAKGKKS